MTSTEQPARQGGFGLSDAAQSIEGILAAELGDNETPEIQEEASKEPPSAEDEDREAVAAEAEEETAGDEPDAEVEATDEDEAEEAPVEDEKLITVKVDGKTTQITAKEAAEGYMRTSDYTRKTQEVAETRKVLESDLQSVQQEREILAQLAQTFQANLQAMQPQEPDWQKLYNEDPLEYVRQKDVWRDRQDQLAKANQVQQALRQKEAEERELEHQRALSAGRAALLERNPQWKDPKRWEADLRKMTETAMAEGFTEAELASVVDPRTVGLLRKAAAYDELMKKKPAPVQHKSPKVAAAGSSANAPRPTTEITRVKQRLAKTGRIADAAALFENFIE